jgi:transcriptional regulator of arginine metabolism
MKRDRQSAILRIIASKDIETQGQLIDQLKEQGIKSTQATLSRDIKALNLVKEPSSKGVYRYVVNEKPQLENQHARLISIFKESTRSFACAQNLVIIKTMPGLAPAACSAIDSMGIHNLIGTIAGDDTGFLAMIDCEAAESFCKEIEKMLK